MAATNKLRYNPPIELREYYNYVAINPDGSFRPSPLKGISYFDGQFFFYRRKTTGK